MREEMRAMRMEIREHLGMERMSIDNSDVTRSTIQNIG